MKKFGVEKPCLYEMVTVVTLYFFPACFRYKLKGINVCAIIVHLWIEAPFATVLMKLYEPWPLQ